MICLVQEFDPKPEITHTRMLEMYEPMAEAWQKGWPSNKLIGLFSHRYYLGPGKQYLAIWQMPNFAALDEWQFNLNEARRFMLELEDTFHDSVVNLRSSVFEKLL